MSVYVDNGYKDRDDYLKRLAADYQVDLDSVQTAAAILGPDEDFTGLVSWVAVTLEDQLEQRA